MKCSLPFLLLLSILFAAAPLAAKDNGPAQFNTIVIIPFTNANGMSQSQNFINMFCDNFRTAAVKSKLAGQTVVDASTVTDPAAATDSLVIEGTFTGFQHSGMISPGKLMMEVSIYRLSDRALVKTAPLTAMFVHNAEVREKTYAEFTGTQTAYLIKKLLEGVSLSSIPAAAPGSAAPGAQPALSSATAPAGPDAIASVQLASDPTGAEISIDGNYVGSTPSQVNLKPGIHAIKMTMKGYIPWVRSIETQAGESRNIAADLDPAKP